MADSAAYLLENAERDRLCGLLDALQQDEKWDLI